MSVYQAGHGDQRASDAILRALTVRGCFVADCAVTGTRSMGGSPWEADNQIAPLSGAHQVHWLLPWCYLIRALCWGCWLGWRVRCCEERGVVPGLLCFQQAVPLAAQPLLPGSGQELTEIHRELILQPNSHGRAWSRLHTTFNTPFQVLSRCVYLL